MKKSILITLSFFFSFCVMAQESRRTQPKNEVAFNMTTLTKKLMPFNVASTGLQRYAMQFRYKLNKEKMYFTSAFGFNADLLENDENLLHFDIRLGLESRKYFASKWYFGSGYNVVAFVHEIENSNFGFGNNSEAGLAFDKSFLLGYKFNEHFSLYTETSFQFGISSETFIKMEMLSPNSIYLNVTF
jgi:hypothetical protein